ncbi:hypothetical protein V5799_026283 [Amblyomma americanum]|uniref:Peptidase M13 C-terminal domain-containing protein n=1 Tax=Amblyomma americanum TaxID=6943 RepID=A0AAQ4DJ07_AMBAM
MCLQVVPPRVVNSARHVVNDLKETLAEKLNNTPWIQNPVRDMVLKRVTDLWIDMAYPDDYANDALVEGFYARFPDVGAYFIPSYIASLRELTIRTFRGHVEARFKAAEANAWYNMEENSVRVCAGVLQPPVYILDAPAALNYGGLGQVVGHEMMHAYDVRNMARDELMKPINFSETQTMKSYEEKVLCLRNSYIKLQNYTDRAIQAELLAAVVPPKGQSAPQKAAALFQACVNLGSDARYSEVDSLQSFLHPLGLDMSDMRPDPSFNVADRIIQLSFVYGLPAYVEFRVHHSLQNHSQLYIHVRNLLNDEHRSLIILKSSLTLLHFSVIKKLATLDNTLNDARPAAMPQVEINAADEAWVLANHYIFREDVKQALYYEGYIRRYDPTLDASALAAKIIQGEHIGAYNFAA